MSAHNAGVRSEITGWFVQVAEHVWEERDLDGNVVATHWTTTKRDRNQQTTLEDEQA